MDDSSSGSVYRAGGDWGRFSFGGCSGMVMD